ncbi:hypothetical protein HanIR_Chr16g0797621 [Helianthus annuus]|nr:hypothetical protein HanIR_Chr16g0797621 [Helianthus annuus]
MCSELHRKNMSGWWSERTFPAVIGCRNSCNRPSIELITFVDVEVVDSLVVDNVV